MALKRICDKCGKEIIHDDEHWFQIRCEKMKYGYVYSGAGVYELCNKCFDEFTTQFANNN